MRNSIHSRSSPAPRVLCFTLLSTAVLAFVWTATAQTQLVVRQIADLNPGSGGSFPSNMTGFNGAVVFSAYTVETGRELWKYDGRGISLVSNINETVLDIGFGTLVGNDSVPYGFMTLGQELCFTAFDPRRGGEPWRFDSTNAFRSADLNPDLNDLIKQSPESSWPTEYTIAGDRLYFSANSGPRTNYELWSYSGGVVTLASNIHPDGGLDSSSYPKHLCAFGDELYFMADDGAHGFELWRHTPGGSTLMDINPGDQESSSYPKYFTPFGSKLYFQAFHNSYGYELWRTDGTNVSLASDIYPGPYSSFPEGFAMFNGVLYFRATDATNGCQLWRYDGAAATLAARINPYGDAFPKNLTVFRGRLYFAADDGANGWELWRYDGTSAALVTNLNAADDAFPESLTIFMDGLYFVATTPETGYELWRWDGTNVTLAADMNPGPGSSFPQNLAVCGNELCFSATADGVSDWELWSLTVKSRPRQVTVVAPEVHDDEFVFAFATEPGVAYEVQTHNPSESCQWQFLATVIGDGTTAHFTNAVLQGAQRLYRIQSK